MNDDEEMSVVFGVLYFENPWLLSWLECIVLRGVDMARTLSEEELMTLMLVTSLLRWLECIVLRGVDMARTLSEEELMTLVLVPCHRTVIKSTVILTSLRLGIVSTS